MAPFITKPFLSILESRISLLIQKTEKTSIVMNHNNNKNFALYFLNSKTNITV